MPIWLLTERCLFCWEQQDLLFVGILDKIFLSVATILSSKNEFNDDYKDWMVKQDLHHNRQKCNV